jgi:hypothetical protein
MDIRRDREEGQRHGGVGMVGGNDQGVRSGDEWDGVVIPTLVFCGGSRRDFIISPPGEKLPRVNVSRFQTGATYTEARLDHPKKAVADPQ